MKSLLNNLRRQLIMQHLFQLKNLKEKLIRILLAMIFFFQIIRDIQQYHLKNNIQYKGIKDSALVDIELWSY